MTTNSTEPPGTWSLDEADTTIYDSDMESDIELDFEPFMCGEPHLITQSELNVLIMSLLLQTYVSDLVRDISLSKTKAKLLGSRLQG